LRLAGIHAMARLLPFQYAPEIERAILEERRTGNAQANIPEAEHELGQPDVLT
jgi:hypothetical protein